MELLTAPTNPAVSGQEVRILAEAAGCKRTLVLVPSDFRAGDTRDAAWCRGVLDQIRSVKTVFDFKRACRS